MMTYPFTKTINGKVVLAFPKTCFHPGQIYAVIGPNGCGKSTLAKVLSGIIPADENTRIWEASPCIGYMPQKNFGFNLSVERNILLNGVGDNKAERAFWLIEKMQLTALRKQKARSLSGGETARMAMARLMMRPYDLLILDEPTADMDIHSTLQTESLLKEYAKNTNCAVLLITHMLKQAQRIADEVLFLRSGILLEKGPAHTVLHQPVAHETKEFLNFYNL